jgi:hypothetical protein
VPSDAAAIRAFAGRALVGGLWTEMGRYGDEDIWRAFGCFGVLSLAGAHACLMLEPAAHATPRRSGR